MFGRATIRLGIGPHSSLCIFYDLMYTFSTLFYVSMLCANVLLGHLSMLVPCCAARNFYFIRECFYSFTRK